MSLRDDLDAMERHQRNGTLKEWFEGTAPILDIDGRAVATPVFTPAEKETDNAR